MSSSLFAALGPGTQLGSLSNFTPDYLAARKALHELLVFPNLDTISLGGSADSTTNLFALVSSGNSRLSDLTNINVDLARKVISYDTTLGILLESFSVQLIVLTMQPVAKGYADQARAESETDQRFFSAFSEYVGTIDGRIGDLQEKLQELDSQIEEQSDALAQKGIIDTLWEALKSLYKLASTAQESDVQIAALLGVTVNTIFGSFKSLFEDRYRLQQIINGLQALRDQISSLKTKFVTLSNGLTAVITNSQDLLGIWDDVATRQDNVADLTDTVPQPIAQEIKSAWEKVADDANNYAQALTQSTTSAQSIHALRSAQFNGHAKVPITGDEIRLHKMVAARHKYAKHVHASATSTHPNLRATAAAVLNDDKKIIEAVIGPPSDTQEELQDLADSTGKIIDQFNNLLQTAYLDQILCTSPIDGSDSNLYIVMNYYREKYLKLQLDTLPVARDLGAYAVLQQTLLPYVKRDDQVDITAGDISMSTYLEINTSMVSGYLQSADALSKRSTEVKHDWDNAINIVKQKINECDANINEWQQNINDLTEEQKKMTLFASLAAFGAFLCFTAAAFIPPAGALLALAAGGILGGLAIWQAMSAGKIIEAINVQKAAIANALVTRNKLEALLKPMEEIAENLTKVSLIWSNITSALTTLDMFYTVLNGPGGPAALEAIKPELETQWGVVNDNVKAYIDTVSG